MSTEGTLTIDGVEYAGIEFTINSVIETNRRTVAAGRFWAPPELIEAARSATDLAIEGQKIVITGTAGDGSASFKPA